jgi:hypothetical protein
MKTKILIGIGILVLIGIVALTIYVIDLKMHKKASTGSAINDDIKHKYQEGKTNKETMLFDLDFKEKELLIKGASVGFRGDLIEHEGKKYLLLDQTDTYVNFDDVTILKLDDKFTTIEDVTASNKVGKKIITSRT